MAYGHAIICRFDTVSDLRGKNRTYANIKAAVLEAGKFSCFDIETNSDGRLFTELCRDPEIETFDMGYPWTGVRRPTKRCTLTPGTSRQNGKPKRAIDTVKASGSPRRK